MAEMKGIFAGILIGLVTYTPFGIYILDLSLPTMLERAYFTLCGAAIALYATYRAHVGQQRSGS